MWRHPRLSLQLQSEDDLEALKWINKGVIDTQAKSSSMETSDSDL